MKIRTIKLIFLLFLTLILTRNISYAQGNKVTDEYDTKLQHQPSGKGRLKLLLQFSRELSQKDFRKSLGFALEAIPLAEKQGSSEQLKEAVQIAGNTAYFLGLMEESAKYRTRYLELVKQEGSNKEFVIAYTNLGGIWIAKGDYAKAGELFIKALDHLKGLSPDTAFLEEHIVLYNNLGIVYRETGDFTKAADACTKGIALARGKLKMQQQLIRLLNNYGELLMDSNNLTGSQTVMNEALSLSLEMDDRTMQAASAYNLSKLLEKKNRYDSSLNYAKKGYALAKELNQPDLIRGLAERLQEVYEHNRQPDSSLHYLKIVHEYDQIIKINEAKEVLLREEMLTEFRQKQEEQKRFQETERMKLWGLSGILLLLVISMALFYFIARNKARKAEIEKLELQLLAQKFEVEGKQLRAELETKNKELTSKVMQQIQRTELIEEIILKLLDQGKGDASHKSIINELKSLKEEDVWKEFDTRFTQVENAFFDKLRAVCADLTMNERRLCALLRMDMSTKEIAALTHQSIRGVEIARIRLRKKLGLTNTEKSLTEFLSNL